MWRVFLLISVLALAWSGWLYLTEPNYASAPIPPDEAQVSLQEEVEEAPLTRGTPGDSLLPGSAPMGIEGGARRSGPDLSAPFEDVAITYNRPQSMPRDRSQSLSVIIDPSGVADAIAILEGYPGDIVQSEVDLSAVVSANLSGPGFTIERLLPERQQLSLDAASRWEWAVTPMQSGVQRLTLELFAYPGGGDVASPVRAYRDDILVTVGVSQRALAFAQTAEPAVGLVAAFISMMFALVGFLRR